MKKACSCCYGEGHEGQCCPGWVHMSDPHEIERCDDCSIFATDDGAILKHREDCGCDWPEHREVSRRQKLIDYAQRVISDSDDIQIFADDAGEDLLLETDDGSGTWVQAWVWVPDSEVSTECSPEPEKPKLDPWDSEELLG